MSFEKVFVTKDTPVNVPEGAGAVVKKGVTPALYLEWENGEAVPFASGVTITSGTFDVHADWQNGTTHISYQKNGNVAHLEINEVSTSEALPTSDLATIPLDTGIRPNKYIVISAVNYNTDAIMIITIAPDGTIGINSSQAQDDDLYYSGSYLIEQ